MIDAKRPLYRLTKDEQIAGVCAGLAEYFDMDVTLVRVIFVVAAFLTGGAVVVLYIILAIVLPSSNEKYARVVNDSETIDKKFQKLGQELKANKSISRIRNYIGAGLILIGTWLLLSQLFPELALFRWNVVWPVVLIIIGITIIFRRNDNGR